MKKGWLLRKRCSHPFHPQNSSWHSAEV